MPKLDDYELLEIIGSGSYSVVHRAKHKVSFGLSHHLSLQNALADNKIILFVLLLLLLLGDKTIVCHKMCGQSESIKKFNGQFTQGNQAVENAEA